MMISSPTSNRNIDGIRVDGPIRINQRGAPFTFIQRNNVMGVHRTYESRIWRFVKLKFDFKVHIQ